jgi:hypothetical protein
MTASELIRDHRDFKHFHDEIVRGGVMNDRGLPICDSSRTTLGVLIDLQVHWSFQALGLIRPSGKRALQHAAFLARDVPNSIAKARKYEVAVAGGTRTYQEVAREFGVTREEVCQYLTLLRRLPADLVASIETETRAEVLRTLSYRRLLAQARAS